MNIPRLYDKINDIAPIVGISGTTKDTLKITFQNESTITNQQKQQILNIIRDFDDTKPEPPIAIQVWQLKAAIINQSMTLYGAIDTNITTGQNNIAKLVWSQGAYISRNNKFLNKLLSDQGLTEDQIDQLFISGAKITA